LLEESDGVHPHIDPHPTPPHPTPHAHTHTLANPHNPTQPQVLQASAAAVLSALTIHPPWRTALSTSLDPAAAGLLLLQHRARLPALVYIRERGLHVRVGLREALVMGQKARYDALGGQEWVDWHQAHREREARAAAAAGGRGGDEWEEGEEEEEGEEGADEGYKQSGSSNHSSSSSSRRRKGGPGPVTVDATAGVGTISVVDGVMVGWPGGPNLRQRHVLRLQWAAGSLYGADTAGLLDAHWRRQRWYREEVGQGEGEVEGGC